MSCGGNRFACGIRRFDKHSFTPDKPINQQLFNENQSRLNDLLKQREAQDKGIFKNDTHEPLIQFKKNIKEESNKISDNLDTTFDENKNTYTPWTVPQGNYSTFSSK
jgi:hypothetical protein